MNAERAVDRQGLGVLNEEQCSALLDSVRLGRVALTDRALPIILPVGFGRLDNDLIFRVGQGALARAAGMQQVVCFEADWMGASRTEAWSVLAIGQLSLLDDPSMIKRAELLDLMQWSPSCSTFVRLKPQVMTGRSLSG